MVRVRQPRTAQRGAIVLTLLVLLLFVLVLSMLYLLRGPLLRSLADWWVVDEPPEKVQAIVVLGGDDVLGDRVRQGVALYHQGYAPLVVLSGPPLRVNFSEAELMEKEARQEGVPADHLIVLRHPATSTVAEAQALRPALEERKLRKLIVVTSNFHTRRARRIFRSLYRRQGVEVIVVAAPDVRFNPARWWQERDGREALVLELLKTVYTWYELWNLPTEAPGAQAFLPAQACGTIEAGFRLSGCVTPEVAET